MFGAIVRRIRSGLRSATNRVTRPAAVIAAQRRHLKAHPNCAACPAGAPDRALSCQAHHVRPFHRYPALGADPGNFITLCEHVGGPEHHLRIGHGGSFHRYNPGVVQDAMASSAAQTRSERAAIVARAKASSVPDSP